jgi:hypothetical protein
LLVALLLLLLAGVIVLLLLLLPPLVLPLLNPDPEASTTRRTYFEGHLIFVTLTLR